MYLKILREDLKHHDMQYKEGLNIDAKPFDLTSVCDGGLFFTNVKGILGFADCGTKIAVVTIPEGNKIVEIDFYGTKKYKTHSFVLSEIRDFLTVETFEWLISLGVDIHKCNDLALRWAAENGRVEVVKFLVGQGADIDASNDYPIRWAFKSC